MTEPSTNEFLPASHNQSDDSSSERRERQYEQMGVLDDQGRKSVEDGASASHGENGIGRVAGARDFDGRLARAPSGPRHRGQGEGREALKDS